MAKAVTNTNTIMQIFNVTSVSLIIMLLLLYAIFIQDCIENYLIQYLFLRSSKNKKQYL